MKKLLKILSEFWIVEILTSDTFVKRFKAFLWHSGAMAAVGSLDLIAQTFLEYDPDNAITIILGLLIAQITKAINNK